MPHAILFLRLLIFVCLCDSALSADAPCTPFHFLCAVFPLVSSGRSLASAPERSLQNERCFFASSFSSNHFFGPSFLSDTGLTPCLSDFFPPTSFKLKYGSLRCSLYIIPMQRHGRCRHSVFGQSFQLC